MPTFMDYLGYLLKVLAIIFSVCFLLVCITRFIPDFDREKSSKTREDLRSITVAIETFCVDNNHYPPMKKDEGLPSKELRLSKRIAKDPFGNEHHKEYSYLLYPSAEFIILLGNGPDRDRDLSMNFISDNVDMSNSEELERFISDYTYDPTNGTKSNGDILRSGRWHLNEK